MTRNWQQSLLAWTLLGTGLLGTVVVSLHVKQGMEPHALRQFAFWVTLLDSLTLTALLFAWLRAIRATRIANQLVAEFRQREQALRDSELRYRTVANFTSDWECWIMPDGTLRYISPSCEQMTGYAPDEFYADPGLLTRIIHVDDQPLYAECLARALDSDQQAALDYRIRTKTGDYRWLSQVCQSVSGTAGQTLERRVSARDITERKKTEAQLRENEARFRHFFEKNASVMLLVDPLTGEIMAANPAAAAYYGYSREQLISMSIHQINILPPARIAEERQKALREERNYFLFPHRLASGEVREVEVYSTPIHEAGRDLLFSIVHDITARKQAEAQLRLAASVFTHAREGIMITNPTGTILDVNAAFTDITSYPRDEVLGQNPRMLNSGRQTKAFYLALWQALAQQGHWYGEVWNRRKNGEVYATLQNISAVRDAEGQIQYYVALFADITQIKEHEHKLERMAHYDALTSLPNRLLLADRLSQGMLQAQRHQHWLAVVYIDLDGFKAVNDEHKHQVGDQLLVAVAVAMKQALREGDTLARIGGDEFVAVLLDLNDIQASDPLLTRLLNAVAHPVQVGTLTLQISASIGVTFYPQIDTVDASQLLHQADQAMYQAKYAGKNRYHLFSSQDAKIETSVTERI